MRKYETIKIFKIVYKLERLQFTVDNKYFVL